MVCTFRLQGKTTLPVMEMLLVVVVQSRRWAMEEELRAATMNTWDVAPPILGGCKMTRRRSWDQSREECFQKNLIRPLVVHDRKDKCSRDLLSWSPMHVDVWGGETTAAGQEREEENTNWLS